jgi:hypothetical protein
VGDRGGRQVPFRDLKRMDVELKEQNEWTVSKTDQLFQHQVALDRGIGTPGRAALTPAEAGAVPLACQYWNPRWVRRKGLQGVRTARYPSKRSVRIMQGGVSPVNKADLVLIEL